MRPSPFPAVLCLSCLTLVACASLSPSTIEARVGQAAQVIPADSGALPPALARRLPGLRVLILGELHYHAEHHAYLAAAAGPLAEAGVSILINEGMSSLGWIARAYAMDEWPMERPLPQAVSGFEAGLLEGLRRLNIDRRKAGLRPLAYDYFDMNHWDDTIFISLSEMAACAGLEEGGAPDAGLLREMLGELSEAYALGARSAAAEAAVREALGRGVPGLSEPWRSRAIEVLEAEAASIVLRRERQDRSRETFMEGRIASFIAQAGDGVVAINTGATHAQRRYWEGSPIERLGTWLARGKCPGVEGSQVYSITCAAIRGEKKPSFASKERQAFDLELDARPGDIVRALGRAADGGIGFLELDSLDRPMDWLPASIATRKALLQRPWPYDAILCYPRLTVLASTLVFE